jgi:NADH dehydrogenase (ubiquinone) 1 beta subcomplex subunit 8
MWSTGKAVRGMLLYISAILSLCGVVYMTYPDKPATPRTFPRGLDVELGGEGALLVCISSKLISAIAF